MAASNTAKDEDKVSLKLMVNTEENRVIFAEADSSFVDTLFSFMTLPLGMIVRLLEKGSDEKVKTLGSLNNLYRSLVDFPDKYMSSEESKFLMLNPRSMSHDHCQKLFASILNMSVEGCIKSQDLKDMLIKPQLAYKYVSQNQIFHLEVSNNIHLFCHSAFEGIDPTEFYRVFINCSDKIGVFSEDFYDDERCNAITFKDARAQGRYLKASAKVMLTDDLVITPLSSISTVSVLKKLKVSLDDVEEHNIFIGIEEGLKILKTSLKSLSTFSDALLKK